MASYNIKVNGKKHQVDVDADTPILWVLRDQLNLLGTKYGCGIGQCGACTIHANKTAIRSCSLPISSVGEMELTTIEGLSENGDHPLQQAWIKFDVSQCGYCQAGQIMNAAALLMAYPSPSKMEITKAMHGNICRCGTYTRINKAIEEAAKNV